MKRLTTLTLFLLAGCCEFDFQNEFYVDPRLEPYVTSFYTEAGQRGIDLHKNLIIRIEPMEGGSGVTKYIRNQRIVLINEEHYFNHTKFYANRLDTLHCIMENLVYHELGHALLDREHCDPCYSIMAQKMSLMEYAGHPDKRKFLIDEMFNPNTPLNQIAR